MSEPLVISPITPVRVSPRFSPSPPPAQSTGPQAIHPPIRPHSTSFFSTNSPSPFNHNSPTFINFSPFPIPGHDLPIPGVDVPFAGPIGQITVAGASGHQGGQQDEDISALLSNLCVKNLAQSSQIQSQAASIALLSAQAQQDKKAIKDLQSDNKNIKDVFHGELLKFQLSQNKSLAHLRGMFDGFKEGFDSRVGRLELKPLVQEHPRIFIEPPHEAGVYFTGMPRETNNFCFSMRNAFEQIGEQFNSEKQKVLWISGYFRSNTGSMEESVPSFVWWRGLLSENVSALGLPTLKASAKMEYVLPQLRYCESFITAIEHTFEDHHELERAEAAFFAVRQGNKTIEEFNILFNALLHPLKLTDRSKCVAYNKAIDPNIIKLALFRGRWDESFTLEARQEIAETVAKNVASVSKTLDPRSAQKQQGGQGSHGGHPSDNRVRQESRTRPSVQSATPRPPQHSKLPDGDPMDVNEVLALLKEADFSHQDFCQACVD
ncbi:hypothetical protein PTTG_29984 [Puccinia triticina 1-1 BBBD Race 1]|uniref:Retrotransposon gag domain-containing protein n=1 Tax=Puccinia triticina (isolate 1-1 / race 1 (BBBD)) TaxID=630390 RepID=A0A180G0Q5_PUCT1|nr:hypothetical protein PTTG_29984 [Puccinia triticina 1-1 BBBD Race 1]